MSEAKGNIEQLVGTERAARVAQIIDMCDYSRHVSGLSDALTHKLTQGCMVVTGLQAGERNQERRLGFCVQIRKGRGQFRSDMVFLRHPDGRLVTHENQGFFLMTPEQEALARPLFEDLPEDEDFTHGYLCCNKVKEVGFIVENSASEPAPDTPFALTVTRTQ
ncbi:hypothetical protein AB4Y45_32885 [Paraburkholderia sp. EG287A]|uniref:hypothetical protein n=1 Tax=Paraburkholderia sp. EG287A TaxID=3237012 RepID=UPI0034D199DD